VPAAPEAVSWSGEKTMLVFVFRAEFHDSGAALVRTGFVGAAVSAAPRNVILRFRHRGLIRADFTFGGRDRLTR
jgi:hypothetical protein